MNMDYTINGSRRDIGLKHQPYSSEHKAPTESVLDLPLPAGQAAQTKAGTVFLDGVSVGVGDLDGGKR